jgi:uncharacterized protein (DUF111 family)
MTIDATGFGAGDREFDAFPNLTQAVLGVAATAKAGPGTATQASQSVLILETNVDDVTGETLAHTISALLEAGALDAWVTPIVMKKGRPAHVVSALCDPVLSGQVAAVLQAETGSLGIRGQTLSRWPIQRSVETVEVDGTPIRVKVSPGRIKVEHDDAARLARRSGLALREVVQRAEDAWRARPDETTAAPDHDTSTEGGAGPDSA